MNLDKLGKNTLSNPNFIQINLDKIWIKGHGRALTVIIHITLLVNDIMYEEKKIIF